MSESNPYQSLDLAKSETPQQKEQQSKTIALQKQVTYILEGASTIAEFWIIGLLFHFWNSSKDDAHTHDDIPFSRELGFFVAGLFCCFYFGRALGGFIGLIVALSGWILTVTYLLITILVIANVLQFFFTPWWAIMLIRALVGFAAGLTPITCLMRVELTNMEATNQREEIRASMIMTSLDASASFVTTVKFLLAFLILMGATALFKFKVLGLMWIAGIVSVILVLITIVFMVILAIKVKWVSTLLPPILDFNPPPELQTFPPEIRRLSRRRKDNQQGSIRRHVRLPQRR